jgi:hypothetical protein
MHLLQLRLLRQVNRRAMSNSANATIAIAPQAPAPASANETTIASV